MKGRKWWLGVVSIIYFAMPLGALVGILMYVDDPALTHSELFLGLHKIALGTLMLYFFRAPERATILILAVVALELFAWLPAYIIALATGSLAIEDLATSTFLEIASHIVIGVTGLLVLRPGSAHPLGIGGEGPEPYREHRPTP